MANITGKYNLANFGIYPYCKAEFHLSAVDTDADAAYIPDAVSVVIGSDGSIDAELWENDNGTRGTVYTNHVVVYADSSYQREVKRICMGKIVVIGDAEIQDLLVTNVVPSTQENALALAQAAAAVAVVAAEAAEDAADVALAGSPYRLPSFAALSRLTYGTATGNQIRVVAGDVVDVPGVGAYQVAPSGASDQHVTTAGGVKLYIADSLVSPAHYGADPTGAVDAAPFVEAVLQRHKTCYLGGSSNTWLLASKIGIPDQDLYVETAYRIIGAGCKVVVGGVDRLFTSAGGKANPGTSSNVFAGKGEISGINFTQNAPSTIFDGDRLYNWYIHDNHFDQITKIIYSGVAKGGEPSGYLQSISFCQNNVSQCSWVVDAKRAFNCTFNNNMFEACQKGIYIDGSGQPAVSGLSVCYNVFEGSSGLFLKLGDYIGLDVSSNYLERNTGGDVDTFDCYIYVSGAASQALSGSFKGNHGQLTAGQIADASFEFIKFVSTTVVLTRTSLLNNWTNGKLVTDNMILNQEGNSSAVPIKSPRSTQVSRLDYLAQRVTATYATNLSAGTLTIAKFTLPNWDATSPIGRTFSLKLNCMLHFLTGGLVMVGGHLLEINLLVMGTEGTAGNSKFVSGSLVNSLAVAAGQVINPSVPTGLTVNHFTAPALTIVESSGVYSLNMSGFAAPSVVNFGASTQFTNSLTVTINTMNRSDAAPSRVGEIVFTA